MRILLAEDERDLADALEAMLKHNNYSVDTVDNGQDALDYLMLDDYDGAILDVMMPKMDGVTVVQKLRENKKSTPVLLLTAKSEIEDKVRLSNKEYQMMEMLMRNPGNVIQTEQFLERIWGYDSDSEINVVWVNISYLRKKLKALDANVQIKATRNVGYTLEIVDV